MVLLKDCTTLLDKLNKNMHKNPQLTYLNSLPRQHFIHTMKLHQPEISETSNDQILAAQNGNYRDLFDAGAARQIPILNIVSLRREF